MYCKKAKFMQDYSCNTENLAFGLSDLCNRVNRCLQNGKIYK